MSIPGFGDAIGLFDVSVRIINFVNDLRHAQDDLLGLHAEANTLRICINSVTSDSCHDALYLYITEDQGRDLKTIVDTCDKNLQDLNRFIGSCAALVEKKGRRDGLWRQKGLWQQRRSWGSGIRKMFAKAWAAYKFTMSDKQAYRDKLILPTQAVNVFLTSMTHVGLANVGMLMLRRGAWPVPQPGGAGSWAVDVAGLGSNNNGTRGPPIAGGGGGGAHAGELTDWDVIGQRVAFRNTGYMRQRHLTLDVEEEVLLYVKHLLKGRDRFSYTFAKGQKRFKVTKAPLGKPRARSRSRSKSRPPPQERLGPLGLGKSKRGQTHVMRKKSISRPSTEGTTVVQRDWESGTDSEGPGGRLLALPAPEYVVIKPSRSLSDEEEGGGRGSGDDDDGDDGRRGGAGDDPRGGGGGLGGPRGPSGGSDGSDDGGHGGRGGGFGARRDNESIIAIDIHEPPRGGRDHGERQRARSGYKSRATYHNSRVTDLDQRKREIEARIEQEQEDAITMVERADEPLKMARRIHLREDTHLSKKQKEDIDEDEDIIDTMRYLDITYGLIVTPAGDRPEVDNGGIDSETEEVDYDPDMSRTDRLKAETTLPTMRPTIATDPERSHRRESGYPYIPRATFEQSRMQPMHDRLRYMGRPPPPWYPRSPSWSGDDDRHRRDVDADELGLDPSRPNKKHPRHQSYADYEDSFHSELRRYDGYHRSGMDTRFRPIIIKAEDTSKERRRSTYHSDHSEDEYEDKKFDRNTPRDDVFLIRRKDDEERKRDSRKDKRNQKREIQIVDDFVSPGEDRPAEPRRRPSYGRSADSGPADVDRSSERRRHEQPRLEIRRDDGHGYYMRGARGDDSGDDDDDDEREYAVRKK